MEELNLCETCQYFPVECPALLGDITFEKEVWNTNVIECSKYVSVEKKEE
jgi:hypothetical protein